MAAARASGAASPEVVAAQLLGVLWLATVTTGSWGAAATAAAGGEETLKCEDLRVGQYPMWTALPRRRGGRGSRPTSDRGTPGGEEGVGTGGYEAALGAVHRVSRSLIPLPSFLSTCATNLETLKDSRP
jgi:hypothetical protein